MDAVATEVDHLEAWAREHSREISEVSNLLDGKKAVLVEGLVHTGKTSLARAVTKQIENQNPDQSFKIAFTTPSVQETFGAKPVKDRTGVEFAKLPSVKELQEFKGQSIIVVDEADLGPGQDWLLMWQSYAEIPNMRFIFLSHPAKAGTKKWADLFPADQTASFILR